MAAPSEPILAHWGRFDRADELYPLEWSKPWSCTVRRRVYVRSTFRAERLWPLIPAFAGLDVDFRFARKQLETIFAGVHDDAERGTR
jgi:hypothetical protein